MPPVPARKIKVPTTISTAEVGGRFKARRVSPGWMQRHGTDRVIVAAKEKFGQSENGTLDRGVKSTQHYGKQLGKVSTYSSL